MDRKQPNALRTGQGIEVWPARRICLLRAMLDLSAPYTSPHPPRKGTDPDVHRTHHSRQLLSLPAMCAPACPWRSSA